MADRLPRVTADQVLRALRRDGWYVEDQKGSHVHLRQPTKRGKVTVSRHRGAVIKLKVLRTILHQAGLTADELWRLL